MARRQISRRRAGRTAAPMEDTRTTFKCAYCEGTGKDPWGIPSILSKCQVCSGRGTVKIQEPAVECSACGGTGAHRGKRLSCLACGGKGRVSMTGPAEKCPRCDGRGVDNFGLYCLACKGKGLVIAREAV